MKKIAEKPENSTVDPIESARKGDAEFFKRVEAKVFVDSRDKNGDSVLSVAVCCEYFDCSRVILQKCPQLLYLENTTTRNNALHYAAQGAVPQIVHLLIGGADKRLFRMLNIDGNTPLHFAVLHKLLETVEFLIDADSDCIFTANKEGETPLMIAQRLASGKFNDGVEVKIRDLLLSRQPKTENAGGEKSSDGNKASPSPTARERELSIPCEHLALYRRIIKEFDRMVPMYPKSYLVDPMTKALANFLDIVNEMCAATRKSVTAEQLLKWESVYVPYTMMGLQISWFPQRISLFRDWLQKHGMTVYPHQDEAESRRKEVELKLDELANLQAELDRLNEKMEISKATPTLSEFDFKILSD